MGHGGAVGTFWAHLGTNQSNLSESHRMLFRRSQPFRRPDLRYVEGSNPSATAVMSQDIGIGPNPRLGFGFCLWGVRLGRRGVSRAGVPAASTCHQPL